MKIAIPLWQNRIAPVLDWCSYLKIYHWDGEIIKEERINIRGMSLAQRLKIIRTKNVKVVICNGVSFFYRACLLINSIKVVQNVYGDEKIIQHQFRDLIAQNRDKKKSI